MFRKYLARQIILMLPTWLAVSVVIFVLMRILPGDVAAAMLGQEGIASEAELASVRHALGLDRPIYIQYLEWLTRLFSLDFGESLYGGQPVVKVIVERIPATVQLSLSATVLSIGLGIPAGVISAVYKDSAWDYLVRVGSILGLGIPAFCLAILTTVILVVYFGWSVPVDYVLPWTDIRANLEKILIPSLILGFVQAAPVARLTRAVMLDILSDQFVVTAYAKGLPRRLVIGRHAMRNALSPIVTLIGNNLAATLGGAVVLEQVFTIPGIGLLLVTAVQRRDYPVVESLFMIIASLIMLVNVTFEAVQIFLDPRVHG